MKSMDLSFNKDLLTIVVDRIVSVHFQNSRRTVIEIRSRAPNSIIVFQFERGPNPRYVKQINDSSTVLLVAADSLISTKIAVDAQVTIAMPIVPTLANPIKSSDSLLLTFDAC